MDASKLACAFVITCDYLKSMYVQVLSGIDSFDCKSFEAGLPFIKCMYNDLLENPNTAVKWLNKYIILTFMLWQQLRDFSLNEELKRQLRLTGKAGTGKLNFWLLLTEWGQDALWVTSAWKYQLQAPLWTGHWPKKFSAWHKPFLLLSGKHSLELCLWPKKVAGQSAVISSVPPECKSSAFSPIWHLLSPVPLKQILNLLVYPLFVWDDFPGEPGNFSKP